MHYILLMKLTEQGARDPKAIPQRIADGIVAGRRWAARC